MSKHLETIPDLILVQDSRTGEYIEAIGGADRSRFDQDAKEGLVGKNVFDIFPKETAEKMLTHFRYAHQYDQTVEFIYPFTHEGVHGTQWYKARIQPSKSEPFIVVVTAECITNEVNLAKKLSESYEKDYLIDGVHSIHFKDDWIQVMADEFTEFDVEFINEDLMKAILNDTSIQLIERHLISKILSTLGGEQNTKIFRKDEGYHPLKFSVITKIPANDVVYQIQHLEEAFKTHYLSADQSDARIYATISIDKKSL